MVSEAKLVRLFTGSKLEIHVVILRRLSRAISRSVPLLFADMVSSTFVKMGWRRLWILALYSPVAFFLAALANLRRSSRAISHAAPLLFADTAGSSELAGGGWVWTVYF